jgi:ppGpp synthetase/RelA/SpoT-type nucleotidyltranferase
MSSIDEFKKQHDADLSLMAQFSRELSHQIEVLIDGAGIKLGFPIQSRLKTWESLKQKVESLELKFESLHEVQDWVGLRIILVFIRDAKRIKQLLERTFEVVRSYDTSDRLGKDQFGYSSFHIVLKMPNAWLAVPALSNFKDFQAEVQVRTLSQHIWAEVSHYLQYKSEENVPPDLLRSIYRSSALLETADLEFERVLREREKYRKGARIGIDISDEEINSDNLEILLDELLPAANKEPGENYSLLVADCKTLGVNKISDLRSVINKHRDQMLEKEKKAVSDRVKEFNDTGQTFLTTEDRMKKGVFFTFVGLARQAFVEEYGKDRVWQVILENSSMMEGNKPA